ncbi:hypothetical protein [Actinopolymorpha sp. B9G3]|uniref:hypothetical protein n=1 Tax=Actinopolymorpha sp. B9G3 TaxID=3158970 RepID=UPI0032D8EBD5
MNDELMPTKERMRCGGQEPMLVEKVDDITFAVRFRSRPNALLDRLLASGNGYGIAMVATPRHYLEQFHKRHNPDIDRSTSSRDERLSRARNSRLLSDKGGVRAVVRLLDIVTVSASG